MNGQVTEAQALSVLSEHNREWAVQKWEELQAAESAAESAEKRRHFKRADNLWAKAAGLLAELEAGLSEIIDEADAGPTLSMLTVDDEDSHADSFGWSLYEELQHVAMGKHDPRSWWNSNMHTDWTDEPTDAASLGAREIWDEVRFGAQLWKRHAVFDLDDPRRPPDAVRTCINVRNQPCGPVQDVWTDGQTFVGSATMLSFVEQGARPARTVEQLAAHVRGERVRSILRQHGAAHDITDEQSDLILDDIFSEYKARLARLAAPRTSGINTAEAWLALRQEQSA